MGLNSSSGILKFVAISNHSMLRHRNVWVLVSFVCSPHRFSTSFAILSDLFLFFSSLSDEKQKQTCVEGEFSGKLSTIVKSFLCPELCVHHQELTGCVWNKERTESGSSRRVFFMVLFLLFSSSSNSLRILFSSIFFSLF